MISAIVVTLGLPMVALAATYDVCPDGSGDFLAIQAAIDYAAVGDIIELCDAIFTGDGNRDLDYLGKAVTVRSQSGNAAACVIDCAGSPGAPHRGFYFHSGEGSGSVLQDVTIMNAFSFAPGGGMHCDASSPTITGCTFLTNLCPIEGAGLFCTNCAPTLTDCNFIDNGDGSGDSGAGMACLTASPTLTNCTFEGNRVNAGGGGLFCGYNSSPSLTECTFERNSVTAPYNGYGAGLFCYYLSSPIVEDCIFLDNDNAGGSGGGAAFLDQCDPQLTDCSFMDNTAESGAGAYFRQTCVPLLDGCTFADNSATSYGGAIWCGGSTPDMISCTLAGNGAGTEGGGIHLYQSSPAIDQTIIAFSTSGAAVYCYDASCVPVLACCDVHGNAGGDWVGCIAAQAGVSGNISLDPEFCDAAAQDYGLETTSPCAPFSPPNPQCDLIGARPVGCGGSDVPDDWSAHSVLVLQISPNPCSGATRIHFEIPGKAAAVTIGVYDPAGRLVRDLTSASLSTVAEEITWDACNAAGARVAAGIYFVQLRAGGQTARERVILLR
jgi:predicted outer membrane repeat protein